MADSIAPRTTTSAVLQVAGLGKRVMLPSGELVILDEVSFDIAPGETFALLGESGCGKAMTALALMRLLPDVATIERGGIEFEGREISRLGTGERRKLRGGAMGMVSHFMTLAGTPGAAQGEE